MSPCHCRGLALSSVVPWWHCSQMRHHRPAWSRGMHEDASRVLTVGAHPSVALGLLQLVLWAAPSCQEGRATSSRQLSLLLATE